MNGAPIWSHPRSVGPFNGLGDVAAMAAESAAAHARRVASYPALVAAEKLTQAVAEIDIWAWQAIAADWAFIASEAGEAGQPATGGTLRARIAALDTAIERFFANIDHAAQKQRRTAAQIITSAQQQQITALLAMRYWAEAERYKGDLANTPLHPRTVVSINRKWAEQRQSKSKAA